MNSVAGKSAMRAETKLQSLLVALLVWNTEKARMTVSQHTEKNARGAESTAAVTVKILFVVQAHMNKQ